MLSLSVVILTRNEEKNLEACLKSLQGWCSEIFVVDSYSDDGTLKIAQRYTEKIYQHPFENQAKQFNWALDNLPISSQWVMRLDADEMVTSELKGELCEVLPKLPDEVSGVYFNIRVHFLGRWIKHGGYYPNWRLRTFRFGRGRCEERHMDEHIVIFKGKTARLRNDIIEWNRKGLSFWLDKHDGYANRKMYDLLAMEERRKTSCEITPSLRGSQEERKRWLEERVYARLPLFLRAFLYFIYRYFFRLGFLDGVQGMIFHFLQGFWYRFWVDTKLYEMRRR